MIQQRWRRIIPVALIMNTISYVDRTNVSLALDPKISSMMHDLLMDDRMKWRAAGAFPSVTCCCIFPVAIWRAGGARKTGQPVPGVLGFVRGGLRPGKVVPSI